MKKNFWLKVYRIVFLCVLLCLTACNNEKSHTDGLATIGPDRMVYMPQFYTADMEADYVQAGCCTKNGIYLVGCITQQVQNLETNSQSYTISGSTIFFSSEADGAYKRLDYNSIDLLDNSIGYVMTSGIWAGGDDTLWVSTYVNDWKNVNTRVLQRLDSTGRVLECIDLLDLTGVSDTYAIYDAITDQMGNIYICSANEITVYNGEHDSLFSIGFDDAEPSRDCFIQLCDGNIGVRLLPSHDLGIENEVIGVVDINSKGLESSYPIPANSKIYAGNDVFRFFCSVGSTLYGLNVETSQLEQIFSWTEVDVNSESIIDFFWREGNPIGVSFLNGKTEIVALKQVDANAVPEKTVLTYATLKLQSNMRTRIIEFNKQHTDYRINVQDYSEYGVYDDISHGIEKLHTEIIAGHIPDILDVSGLPLQQYGVQGLLEDLWPYIDGDPEIGRANVMTHVMEAAQQNGKLYQAFDSYSILTVAGSPDIVGAGMSWDLDDFCTALKTIPENSTVLGLGVNKMEALRQLLPMQLDCFVDYTTSLCRFDDDNFRTLLEFCNTFPMNCSDSLEDEYAQVAAGDQMLLPAEIGGLDWNYLLYQTAFGGECTFIGYPREDGGVGSCFKIPEGIAMTTACKDKVGAWHFIREMFLPQSTEDEPFYCSMLPINKMDFDRMVTTAMTPIYQYDADGNIVVDENGNPEESIGTVYVGGLSISSHAITQNEYSIFWDLYTSIDTIYTSDTTILSIIEEEVGAYFSGDKSLEQVTNLIQSRASLYLNEIR